MPLVLAFVVAGLAAVASAHTPHDPASQVLLSPAYAEDSTGFVVSEGRILRSDDALATFVEVVNGVTSAASSVAMSPADTDVVYATTSDGYVLRSTDGGQSFATLVEVSAGAVLVRSAVAFDNADNVLVGDFSGAVWRTEDSGATWAPVSGLDPVTALVMARSGPDRFYVGTLAGDVLISDDGGASWFPASGLSGESITAITELPSDPSHVYVGDETGAITESLDSGASFSPLAGDGLDGNSILDITIDENADGSTIWATTTNGPHRSVDQGATFEPVIDGLTVDAQATEMFSPGFSSLAVDSDGQTLLAGFDGLFRLDADTGAWTADETRADEIVGLAISPDFANDGTVVVTTYVKGAYRSEDRGATFESIGVGLEQNIGRTNTVLPLNRLQNVVFSPDYANDRTLFSSSSDDVLVSNDGGASWEHVVASAASDRPSSGNHVIGVGQSVAGPVVITGSRIGVISRSDRRGAPGSWIALADLGARVRSVVLSPNFATQPELFVATTTGIYRSTDGGSSFERTTETILDAVLAISPEFGEDRTIYAGSPGGLAVSRDGGETWEPLEVAFAPTKIEAIALSPSFGDDGTVLVSLKGLGLFRSNDRGSTFENVATDLTADNLIASATDLRPTSNPIQFAADGTVLAYAGGVVLVSDDAGTTWASTELPSFKAFIPPSPIEPPGPDGSIPADGAATPGDGSPTRPPGDAATTSRLSPRDQKIWMVTGAVCVVAFGGLILSSRKRR